MVELQLQYQTQHGSGVYRPANKLFAAIEGRDEPSWHPLTELKRLHKLAAETRSSVNDSKACRIAIRSTPTL